MPAFLGVSLYWQSGPRSPKPVAELKKAWNTAPAAAFLKWYHSEERYMATDEDGRIVETTMEARAAERGPTVRNVLVTSLGLVIVGLAVVFYFFFRS